VRAGTFGTAGTDDTAGTVCTAGTVDKAGIYFFFKCENLTYVEMHDLLFHS